MDVCPADLEIIADEHGRPWVGGELIRKTGCNLSISIAHTRGRGVAVACESEGLQGVGVDMEYVTAEQEGLEKLALSSKEELLLSVIPSSKKAEWVIRLWCAKEAVAKALGCGMAGGPWNLAVQERELETGQVNMKLAGQLARQMPEFADRLLTAYTGCEDDLVFATSLVRKNTK